MTTQKQVAEHIDMTTRNHRDLVKRGLLPPSKGRGGYDLDATRVTYIRHLRGVASGQHSEDPDALDLTAERARKERAQAEKTEFDLAVAKQQYVHISVFEGLLERFASIAASRFDAIRSRLKVKYPTLTPEIIDGITKEIAEARNAVAVLRPPFDAPAAKGARASR